MRLFRYAAPDGHARVAAAIEGRDPVDLAAAWSAAEGDEPTFSGSTAGLIEAGAGVWRHLAEVIRGTSVPPLSAGASWLCPLDRLSSLRDFLAFESHVLLGAERRGGQVPDYWYEAPVCYKGNHRAVLGPDEQCPWPPYTERLDFELELALIVGRGGRDLQRSDAGAHIFGFTVFNDFSARDVQAREMSAWLGPAKGKDFANALGPCIVTVDDLGVEPDLAMVCRVNGVEWGRARSSEMHWKWADIVAHASWAEDLWPGDVLGSGTPGGCCGLDIGRTLEPGDVVELEIEGIGVLRNPIGPRPDPEL